MKEVEIMRRIQVLASKMGARLLRNNVGMLKDARGQYVRYGLGPGSSDLIGWCKVKITQEMVGSCFAQFLAVECKSLGGGSPTKEQIDFIQAVQLAGGKAFIAWSEDDLKEQLG